MPDTFYQRISGQYVLSVLRKLYRYPQARKICRWGLFREKGPRSHQIWWNGSASFYGAARILGFWRVVLHLRIQSRFQLHGCLRIRRRTHRFKEYGQERLEGHPNAGRQYYGWTGKINKSDNHVRVKGRVQRLPWNVAEDGCETWIRSESETRLLSVDGEGHRSFQKGIGEKELGLGWEEF